MQRIALTILLGIFYLPVLAAGCSPEEKLRMIKLGLSNAEILSICDTSSPAASNQSSTDGRSIIINVDNSSQNNSINTQTQVFASKKKKRTSEKFFWQVGLGIDYLDLEDSEPKWDDKSGMDLDFFSMVYFPSYMDEGNFGFGFQFANNFWRTRGEEYGEYYEEISVQHIGIQILYDLASNASFHFVPFVDGGFANTDREISSNSDYEEKFESSHYGAIGFQLIDSDVNKGSGWYFKASAGQTGTISEYKEPANFYRATVGYMW